MNMSRFLLIFAAVCVGLMGFGWLRRAVRRTHAATAIAEQQWAYATNGLALAQAGTEELRRKVQDQRRQLHEALSHPEISPELLALLESRGFKGSALAWTQLRQELGLGWDCSPDYVLVSKRVLPSLEYSRLLSGERASDTACDLLAISAAEKTALRSTLQHMREGQWLNLQRAEPGGDVVAQYTMPPPDPALDQTVSNNFFAAVTSILGQDRADLFSSAAWRELRSDLAPREAETLTIRQTVVDGEPDLVWEMKRGGQTWSDPVRYARYPGSWFLKVFPGGWKALAEREGFELPARFQGH